MTIVSALKKLHKKMTGKDATGLNIAGVIDSLQANYTGGGGGEPYEPLFTMQLGEPVTPEGAPEWATIFDVSGAAEQISALEDERIPIYIACDAYMSGEKIKLSYEDEIWSRNCTVIDRGITWDDPNEDCFLLGANEFVFGSNVNFSNCTVTVYKKVSGGSGEDNDFVVIGSVEVVDEQTHVSTDKTVEEILAAHQEGKNVHLVADAGFFYYDFPLTAYGEGSGSGVVSFGGTIGDVAGQKTLTMAVVGRGPAQGETDDTWDAFSS